MKLIFLLLGFFIFSLNSFSQVKVINFNRFHFNNFQWQEVQSDSAAFYYPEGMERMSDFCRANFGWVLQDIKDKTGWRINSKIYLFLYPSELALSESNIGILLQANRGLRLPKLKPERVALCFKGTYNQLLFDMKMELARTLWQKELTPNIYSFNSTEIVPNWFKEGLLSHIAGGWTFEDELTFTSLLSQTQDTTWRQLQTSVPTLTGRAFCNYLNSEYREDACKQILFQLKARKSFETSVRLITKKPLLNLEIDCIKFYKERSRAYKMAGLSLKSNPFSTADERKLFSPDSSKMVVLKRRRAGWQGIETDENNPHKKRKLFFERIPPWLQASKQFIPEIKWMPSSSIAVAFPSKGRFVVRQYNGNGSQIGTKPLYGIDGLLDFYPLYYDYWILNAFKQGTGGILSFNPQKIKYTPLTNGLNDYTRLSVSLLAKSSIVLAYRVDRSWLGAEAKNSVSESLKPGVYYHKINEKRTASIPKEVVADSLFIRWGNPHLIDNKKIATNWGDILMPYGRDENSKKANETAFNQYSNMLPWVKDWLAQKEKDTMTDSHENDPSIGIMNDLIKENYLPTNKPEKERGGRYLTNTPRPYFLRLYSTQSYLGLNNHFLFNRYQPYQAGLGQYNLPDLSAIAEVGFADIFDNHIFNFGVKLPIATSGSTFLFGYKNLTKTVDWFFNFYRMVQPLKVQNNRDWVDSRGFPYPVVATLKTAFLELGFKKPFTYVSSVEFSTALRRDKTVFPAYDLYSLDFPAQKQYWWINTLSYHTETVPFHNELQVPDVYRSGGEFDWSNHLMIAKGKPGSIIFSTQIKADYKLPLLKPIWSKITAQMGYSGGRQKVLFIFGGVDQNLTPKVNDSFSANQDAPYGFQALITPFRGVAQNELNGSQFLLINFDIYSLPIQDIFSLPFKISAIQDLSLGLFSDFGIARGENPFPTLSPKKMTYSFGFNIRTSLAGYPLLLDIGWERNFKNPPLAYLSFEF